MVRCRKFAQFDSVDRTRETEAIWPSVIHHFHPTASRYEGEESLARGSSFQVLWKEARWEKNLWLWGWSVWHHAENCSCSPDPTWLHPFLSFVKFLKLISRNPFFQADLKGLQIGDQIIRVGGSTGSYRVDDAVHKELSQFIINQDRLTLKVRGEWDCETLFKSHYQLLRHFFMWLGNCFSFNFITFSKRSHDKWSQRKISFGRRESIVNK